MSNSFKGEFKVTTQSLMGKADVKKLRSLLLAEHPALTKKVRRLAAAAPCCQPCCAARAPSRTMHEVTGAPRASQLLNTVLSEKKEISILKCSNGTTLYTHADSPPAFFDDGFGGVYPTLFTLWRLPQMLPELLTHGPVSKFLLPKERSAGADMMLPGVIVPDGGLGEFDAGQKRLIRVEGNAMAIGVGKMLVSSKDIASGGMKGKGMAVLHVYRDSLWAYGGRKVPNEGFQVDQARPVSQSGLRTT